MKRKVDNSTEDDAPRDSLIDRIRPFILVFLLVILPIALFHAFKEYMYVCRIPAGTKVVDKSMVRQRSRLGEYLYSSGFIKKWNCEWIKPYLDYRHYVIPDGVEEIRDGAFFQCDNLRSVRISGSVKRIGFEAFSSCYKLEEIVIPDGVTKIGREAFAGCANLKRVTLPSGLTGIEYNVFGGCTSLEQVDIPESVKTIGECAFYGCTNLKRVTIPDGVTKIGNKAFEGTSVQITKPDAPKTVPGGAGTGSGTGPDTDEMLRQLMDRQLFGSYGTGKTRAEQTGVPRDGKE